MVAGAEGGELGATGAIGRFGKIDRDEVTDRGEGAREGETGKSDGWVGTAGLERWGCLSDGTDRRLG